VELAYRGVSHPKLAASAPWSAPALAQLAGEYVSDELQTRYRVEVRNDTLMLVHPRHGTIPLTWLWGNDFGGSAWFTRSVEFRRDSSGRVVGFAVTVDERSRNIQFIKRQ